MQKIINEVSQILDDFQKDREKMGLDYNVFSLMDIERNEVTTHEYMIYYILNHKNIELREAMINQFLISMGLPKSFQNEKWKVEKEHYTESYGRIDLFFTTQGHSKKCIIVELKIDAGDQERQLERYEEYVLENQYDFRIIYLTLDGKRPSEQSCEGLIYPRKLLCRSFADNLLEWLECCMEICKSYHVDASFIQQYKILLMKITREENMEEKIIELINSSKELKACLALEKALPSIKGQLLYEFMDAIYQELDKKNCEFLYDDYEDAINYYDGKSHCPQMVCRITNFTSRGKQVSLALGIEVYYNLYFYIGYFDEDNELLENEQFKKANKRINARIENAIAKALGIEIRSNNYSSIADQRIYDANGTKYDFKHFNESCAELKDESVLKSEAKRIARNIMYYIKEIQKNLKDEE